MATREEEIALIWSERVKIITRMIGENELELGRELDLLEKEDLGESISEDEWEKRGLGLPIEYRNVIL